MNKRKTSNAKVIAKLFKSKVVHLKKAAHPTNKNREDASAVDKITPRYNMAYLLDFRNQSTMLGQCISAYSTNTVGRGWYLHYKNKEKETAQMKAEWDFVQTLLENFGADGKSLTEILKIIEEHKLATGNAYIEVIRNLKGEVVEIDFVSPVSMYLMPKSEPIEIEENGIRKMRRFRRFVQEVNGERVFFKEFGDPRPMNRKTGKYEDVPYEQQANEIIHITDVNDGGAYGIPRWMGQFLHMHSARKAEELNYRYFVNGKHIPYMVILSGGTLTAESEAAIRDYLSSISSEQIQHQMLFLEIQKLAVTEEGTQPDIKVQPLTTQQDGLFQELIKNSDDKVQSAFGLPDLYVGKTREINRATAETTRQHAENTIFATEREFFEDLINKKLLKDYNLQYVEVKFKKQPEYSDIESRVKALETLAKLGAITRNEVRAEASNILGKEFEPFQDEESNLPIKLQFSNQQQNQQETEVQKSLNNNWLKDVRDSLEEISQKIRDDEDETY